MSFPRYPKYKASGVEWLSEVPTDWHVRRLKFVARLITDKASTRQNPIALENVEGWTGRLLPTESEFAGDGTAFQAGDILFGKLRPYLAKAFLADAAGESVGDFHVLRPNEKMFGRFLQYQMLTPAFIDVVDGATFGSKMPRADWESVGAMSITVPMPQEQIAIAGFLDREAAKIDALIAEQRRLIDLLKEKRQAVISHAVTKGLNPDAPLKPSGIDWLGDVPANWTVGGLTKYLASVVDYRGRTPEKTDEGVFLITARNIRDGRIDYEASQEYIALDAFDDVMRRGRPELGDVLFTTEAPLGQVANVDRTDVALAQRVLKFRGQSNVLSNYFLKYWLMGAFSQADMERLATVSTALGIKGSKVVQLRLCLPPYEEQKKIAAVLDKELARLDELVARVREAIELLQERRSSLISAAVTGKIDVRGLVTAEAV